MPQLPPHKYIKAAMQQLAGHSTSGAKYPAGAVLVDIRERNEKSCQTLKDALNPKFPGSLWDMIEQEKERIVGLKRLSDQIRWFLTAFPRIGHDNPEWNYEEWWESAEEEAGIRCRDDEGNFQPIATLKEHLAEIKEIIDVAQDNIETAKQNIEKYKQALADAEATIQHLNKILALAADLELAWLNRDLPGVVV